MGTCKVSLIIPVYNVEKYLEKCLDSAVYQTLRDIEIIIVNDGSTDSSPSIIEAYAARDPRISVIHQRNAGLSMARNAGIQAAKADYIAFMDSDDWMDYQFMERMYGAMRSCDADIVVCNHAFVFDKFVEISAIKHRKSMVLTGDKAFRKVLRDSGIQSYAWGKLYKKALFEEHGVLYPEGLYFEDMGTTFKLFYYAKRVAVIEDCLYYYLQRGNSISKKLEPKRVYDIIIAVSMMRKFLEEQGTFQRYYAEYRYLCKKMYFVVVANLFVIYGAKDRSGMFKRIGTATRRVRRLMLTEEMERRRRKAI